MAERYSRTQSCCCLDSGVHQVKTLFWALAAALQQLVAVAVEQLSSCYDCQPLGQNGLSWNQSVNAYMSWLWSYTRYFGAVCQQALRLHGLKQY